MSIQIWIVVGVVVVPTWGIVKTFWSGDQWLRRQSAQSRIPCDSDSQLGLYHYLDPLEQTLFCRFPLFSRVRVVNY
jgi:hypothetical protein